MIRTFNLGIFLIIILGFISYSCKKNTNDSPDNLNNQTELQNPTTPLYPFPADASVDQILITLSWTACTDPQGDAVVYDLYLGNNSNPQLFASGITEATYEISILQANTTYYWKVVAKDQQGNTTQSNVWNFRTSQYTGSGTISDPRDNHSYQYQQIGDKVWLKENISLETTSGSYFYNNDAIYSEYGRLYDFETAKSVCPQGWHIPSEEEWMRTINYLGGTTVAGGKMREQGTSHWNVNPTETDNSSSFTALAGGLKTNTNFINIGYEASFWSSTEGASSATYFSIDHIDSDIQKKFTFKSYGMSVRCVKD
ncbi:MAG: hypothetical protein A2275_15300 [Bacteroidetes bacterium RIFOXYA12_FULL_35_11]|nr:MAG: hypothetical protein A2X01_08120 [Bacteroidetes bacterium GWF2_35_48]OFY83303.1 MAG: hypothetical protein A2275_15300 [Bacteroidetes bacterium RIFOXYA12_FULL_35_11]OFY94906.1 MAG: hypothetical protein A2309_06700 [Bacteroidetes bacterium RIFOXYB2_FULL_35_7]HBX52659.1 hypothetical protein [Bacteroidales bacterium]